MYAGRADPVVTPPDTARRMGDEEQRTRETDYLAPESHATALPLSGYRPIQRVRQH